MMFLSIPKTGVYTCPSVTTVANAMDVVTKYFDRILDLYDNYEEISSEIKGAFILMMK